MPVEIDEILSRLYTRKKIGFSYGSTRYATELIDTSRIISSDEHFSPEADIYRVTVFRRRRMVKELYYADPHGVIKHEFVLSKNIYEENVKMIGALPQPISEEILPHYRFYTQENIFHLLTLFEFVSKKHRNRFLDAGEIHKIKVAECRK
jgi:hypothetical protein